jgi:hypothetical protein
MANVEHRAQPGLQAVPLVTLLYWEEGDSITATLVFPGDNRLALRPKIHQAAAASQSYGKVYEITPQQAQPIVFRVPSSESKPLSFALA